EKERQHSDHDPAEGPAFSTFAKQEKKKRARNKDRTTEGDRAQVGEYRHIYHTSKQHFIGVPANVVEGEQSVSVPRLVYETWNSGISKIRDGTETHQIVGGGQKQEDHWNGEETTQRYQPGTEGGEPSPN